MPRRSRPPETHRSEHWLRKAVNEHQEKLDDLAKSAFNWKQSETIEWLSPIASDGYAEYYDEEFLTLLGLSSLKRPLSGFWPKGGPRWDGLAKTRTGKLILVEAKAYIEEGVDFGSRAGSDSLAVISTALDEAKRAFEAPPDAPWEAPFYQYANRLAHLYFLNHLNDLPTYLLFLYFADAPDVPTPCSVDQWEGAVRLTSRCLGLGEAHPFKDKIAHLIWSDTDLYKAGIGNAQTVASVAIAD
jgi:hypothetical protein